MAAGKKKQKTVIKGWVWANPMDEMNRFGSVFIYKDPPPSMKPLRVRATLTLDPRPARRKEKRT